MQGIDLPAHQMGKSRQSRMDFKLGVGEMRQPYFNRIGRYIALGAALAVSTAGLGQVTVQPKGLAVPESKVNVLYGTTFRVVAEEFRLRDASEIRVPVTLVLGEGRDGVVGDESNQVFTIYMSRWDEAMFATAVSRIALQHLLSQDRKARIVRESLRRAHLVAPVSADSLTSASRRDLPEPAPPLPRAPLHPARQCLFSAASPFPAEGKDHTLSQSSSFCQLTDQFVP